MSILETPVRAQGEVLHFVVLLDTSGSMAGHKIESLKKGFHELVEAGKGNGTVASTVELTAIAFSDGAEPLFECQTLPEVERQHLGAVDSLQAGGCTSLGAALKRAMELVAHRKRAYAAYKKPWIAVITDGEPTDHEVLEPLYADLQAAIAANKFSLYFFVPGGQEAGDAEAREAALEISRRAGNKANRVLAARKDDYAEAFKFLLSSMKAVSSTPSGQAVSPDKPAGLDLIQETA